MGSSPAWAETCAAQRRARGSGGARARCSGRSTRHDGNYYPEEYYNPAWCRSMSWLLGCHGHHAVVTDPVLGGIIEPQLRSKILPCCLGLSDPGPGKDRASKSCTTPRGSCPARRGARPDSAGLNPAPLGSTKVDGRGHGDQAAAFMVLLAWTGGSPSAREAALPPGRAAQLCLREGPSGPAKQRRPSVCGLARADAQQLPVQM